jgi:hypothetical protein
VAVRQVVRHRPTPSAATPNGRAARKHGVRRRAKRGITLAIASGAATAPCGTQAAEENMTTEAAVAPAVIKKIVYAVTEKGERSYWTKIGVAFVNRDGSLSVRLDAMPMNGSMQIREEEPRRFGGGQ